MNEIGWEALPMHMITSFFAFSVMATGVREYYPKVNYPFAFIMSVIVCVILWGTIVVIARELAEKNVPNAMPFFFSWTLSIVPIACIWYKQGRKAVDPKTEPKGLTELKSE